MSRPEGAGPSLRLDNRKALVTGAGGGIGAAAATALASAGAHVVLLGRTRSSLEKVAAEIEASGGRALPLVCDVTDTAAMREAIGDLDSLDILLNNAGTNVPEPFVDVSDIHLDSLLNLNVRAAFQVAQAAVRKMLEDPDRRLRGGIVINVTSQMGHVGAPNRSVYCMTKHALEGLTKAMAVELAPHNIRVNSVAPTFVETPLTKAFFASGDFNNWALQRIPLGRLGKPEDIAWAIVFLASSAASLITGAGLLIDGGWTAQ
jgi:NAD(P)-dependent dehydrogenase (short-subunit alcohol dehydrogenase family)